MPWPLVQPPLILVPIPTKRPAIINKMKEFEIVILISLLVKKHTTATIVNGDIKITGEYILK